MRNTTKLPKVKALKDDKTIPKRMFYASHEANEFISARIVGMKCKRHGE